MRCFPSFFITSGEQYEMYAIAYIYKYNIYCYK